MSWLVIAVSIGIPLLIWGAYMLGWKAGFDAGANL